MQYALSHFIPSLYHDKLFSSLFVMNAYMTDSACCCTMTRVARKLSPRRLLERTIQFLPHVYVIHLGTWSLPLRVSVPQEDNFFQAADRTIVRFSLAARDFAASDRILTDHRGIVPAWT